MEFPHEKYVAWFAEHEERIKQDFFRFLRFPSISTDPERKKDCLEAADWLVSYLQETGMDARQLESPGLPVVFGSSGGEGKEVLLYHHYDVQPVDPIELWTSDPFEPRESEGKIFARGASDNKGQAFATLTALKALYALEGKLPLPVKIFIEGEEESGGEGTRFVLQNFQELLRSDFVCVIDFDAASETEPRAVLGYRGLVAFHIECTNAGTDLHSGGHGGIAGNAIHILTKALAECRDANGKIVIPGFYEGIEPLEEEYRRHIDFSFNEEEYRKTFGVGAFAVEEGYLPVESNWLRPTLEVNGIWGGYTGSGFKTVIPAKAYAKLSCRLVPGQDPKHIEACLVRFLQSRIPSGAHLSITLHHAAQPYRGSGFSPLLQIVTKSLEQVFSSPCRYALAGGSVPIVKDLIEATGGADTALFGFALESDNIHAPDEHFRWACFKKGVLGVASVLWNLGIESQNG